MPERAVAAPIYIAGPTASGKTQFSLRAAEELGGEIISVDSMQVYQGMDIGTAKPSKTEQAKVPHHLIDVVPISEPFDVADFLKLARAAQEQIEARGKVPIFCGGTGLYFKGLISGIGTGPPSDERLRAELESLSLEELLEELARKDPESFAAIDRKNRRRVVRAVEVIRVSGRKFSEQRSEWQKEMPAGTWIGLQRDREELVRRIDERVEKMFADGLVEETRLLLEQGLRKNRTAMQALGYRQVVDHLEGKLSLAETIALVKLRTRQFAKRQMTWFRHQLQLHWLRPGEVENAQLSMLDKLSRGT